MTSLATPARPRQTSAHPSPPHPSPYPSPSRSRLLGLDVARALAILGMFAAHVAGPIGGFDWGAPSTWLDIANGRSSILFATLAGVTLALMTGRQTPLAGAAAVDARLRILVRAGLLWLLGESLSMFGTPVAVILETYAVLFAGCLLVAGWRARRLFVAAGVMAVAGPLLVGVLQLVAHLGGSQLTIMLTLVYPLPVFVAFVLAGMAIGRSDLTSIAVRVRLVVVGGILATGGYIAGSIYRAGHPLPSSAGAKSLTSGSLGGSIDGSSGSSIEPMQPDGFGVTQLIDFSELWRFGGEQLFSVESHSGTVLDTIASGGFALAIIGVCLLVTNRLRVVLTPLIAVGSMSLTLYAAHIVAIAVLNAVILVPKQSLDYVEIQGGWVLLAFVGSALVFATVWKARFGRGPLERLVGAIITRVTGGR